MSKREDFVNKALSWLGTKEGSKGHKQIVADYNKACDKGRKMDVTTPWCAGFVGAVAEETGNVLADGIGVPVDCSCGKMIDKAKAAGIWVEADDYNPRVGDVIMYDWHDSGKGDDTTGHDHTGIVTKAGNPFTVTEGNKNDAVGNRSVKVNAKNTRGFIAPKFADETAPAPIPAPTPEPPKSNKYKVKTNTGVPLRLRAAPNTKSVVLARIPNGTVIEVNGESNGWAHTAYAGYTGWASMTYLKNV